MSIEKKSIPYPTTNNSKENEIFLKWCFTNGNEGKDLWSTFAYKSQHEEPINLIEADLNGLNLQGIYLSGVKLGSANLHNALLTSANLFEANLIGADLTQANLSHANLNEADFFKANLTNTNFTNAYLKNAYLKEVIISDTIFDKADLEGTLLDPATNKKNELQEKSSSQPMKEKKVIDAYNNEFVINKTQDEGLLNTLTLETQDEVTSGSEIHGYVELQGKIFHKNIDLRDINFFTNKISNILRHTFNATNTSKLLKNNFNISLGKIEENLLNLNLNLDFGMKLPPLLLNRQMQIWNIANIVIETLKQLGQNFESSEPLKITNTDSSRADVIVVNKNNKQYTIENHIYKIIHNTLEDIKELNLKILNKELNYIKLNGKKLMKEESVDFIFKGIDIFTKIKEQHLNDVYQAQIEVIEFNTQTNAGVARVFQANFKNSTIFEETPFELENESLEKILDSMRKKTILVNFRPIIENFGNKQLVKKMILTL